MSNHDLRAEHIARLTGWIATYHAQGHPLAFETRHEDGCSEIVFRIGNWAKFVEVMEPGSMRVNESSAALGFADKDF